LKNEGAVVGATAYACGIAKKNIEIKRRPSAVQAHSHFRTRHGAPDSEGASLSKERQKNFSKKMHIRPNKTNTGARSPIIVVL
jgi:hypothetical protein